MTGTDQACSRRQTATWTHCQCDPCRRRNRRLDKLTRAGMLRPSPSDEAHEALAEMRARGWSRTAIASATGMPLAAVHSLYDDRARTRTIGRVRAAQLINHGHPTAGHVGATGATRRLQALAVMGWDTSTLAARAGLRATALMAIRNGERATVSVALDAAVRQVFAEVCMSRGPSARTVDIAVRRHGWAPPLAWDDIDDPAERPRGMHRERSAPAGVDEIAVARAMAGPASTPDLTAQERRLVVGRLSAVGCTGPQIAAHLRVDVRTVQRDRDALGLVARAEAVAS